MNTKFITDARAMLNAEIASAAQIGTRAEGWDSETVLAMKRSR